MARKQIRRERVTRLAIGGALGLSIAVALGGFAGSCIAAETSEAALSEAEELRLMIELQRQQIEAQRKEIEAQRLRLEALEKRMAEQYPQAVKPAVYSPPAPEPESRHVPAEGEAVETQVPTGEPPPQEEERPEVAVFAEKGGVLTPKGTLVVEPSVEFAHSSINRFNFQGIEIFDVILIGDIEASDADRDTVLAATTFRLGVTDRLEVEAKVPAVFREDRVTNTIITPPTSEITTTTQGWGLGDIEVAGHYQMNDGGGGMPFLVGNLRIKTDTGEGPFDVDRDANGIATELPTGSGFWGIQPSLTAILPSDPAVFFGNISYLWNIERDIDKTVGGSSIGTVDPGDSVGFSLGMGFGINERASFNLGYEHNYVFKTTTEIDGVEVESDDLQAGAFLTGISYRLSDIAGLNLSASIGATSDAPDVKVGVRVPISISLF